MLVRSHLIPRLVAAALASVALLLACSGCSTARLTRQQSLDEWRALTGTGAPAPRVFVKGEQVRFYFPGTNGVEAFKAVWSRVRVPTSGYKVKTAMLRWDQKLLRLPEHDHGWREARVIAGSEWRKMATNLIAELTPRTPGHGAYYQGFLADGLLYRDQGGLAHFVPLGQQPRNIFLERQYSNEETLDAVAHAVSEHLSAAHPGETLFLLLAPNAKRFAQPVLLDQRQRRCVLLMPAALYDWSERGMTPSVTAQGLSAILFESHALALLKNPVSSAARAADLAAVSAVRFIRLPLRKGGPDLPAVRPGHGMNLAAWEQWLDRYTGTHLEQAKLNLLIDGGQFFPTFRRALAAATNHIRLDVYIFDRDDVALQVADELKARSRELEVKVLLDRMGCIGAGLSPPSTPMPEHFVAPASIIPYLRQDSEIQVRKFLNPWFSSDHEKLFLIDGAQAFLGGMNFGREYRYEWHDMMVQIEGPVVNSLEAEFERKWAHAGPWGDAAYLVELLKQADKHAGQKPPEEIPGKDWIKVRLLPTRTWWKPFGTAVLNALRSANQYIFVENPYLFDKRVIHALVDARSRGVDVRVVLPRVNDFKAGGRGNLVIANYLIERGVRVFFYPGMTHVKALLADGWACIGSGNLNHLSLRVNQEQNIATSDPGFASRLRQELFEEDFSRSYELKEPVALDWMDFVTDFLLEGF